MSDVRLLKRRFEDLFEAVRDATIVVDDTGYARNPLVSGVAHQRSTYHGRSNRVNRQTTGLGRRGIALGRTCVRNGFPYQEDASDRKKVRTSSSCLVVR